MGEAAGEHDLFDGERDVGGDELGNVRDLAAEEFAGQPVDGLAAEGALAGGGGALAGDQIEQGRFAGAVGADDADDGRGGGGGVDAMEDGRLAGVGELEGFERQGGHWSMVRKAAAASRTRGPGTT